MKNLALVFCSIRPQQLSENVCDYREIEYFRTISQLQRVIPKSFDMVVVLVCDVVESAKNFLIPDDFITKIKEKIEFAEMKKNSSIPLIGMNPCLSNVNKKPQIKLFDGNFIDKPMKSLEFKDYLHQFIR